MVTVYILYESVVQIWNFLHSGLTYAVSVNQSINQSIYQLNSFIVCLKVDQRAGQLSLPHLEINITEKIELKRKTDKQISLSHEIKLNCIGSRTWRETEFVYNKLHVTTLCQQFGVLWSDNITMSYIMYSTWFPNHIVAIMLFWPVQQKNRIALMHRITATLSP